MNTLETFVARVDQEYGTCSKDIIWRLVYYKPNDYSDEAISVGVVINHEEELSIDHICSTDALEVFHRLLRLWRTRSTCFWAQSS